MDRAHRNEAGMVTAETALVLPIVTAFVMTLVWLISVGISEVRLVDVARDAARAIARGDDEDSVEAYVAARGPRGAQIDVTRSGNDVTVDVAMVAEAPGWLLIPLPGIDLRATATTEAEVASDAAW